MDYHFLKKIIKKNRFNKKATIGNNVSIGSYSNCISSDKKNIIIGNNCFIDAVVYSFGDGKITIGNNCYINYSTFIGASESVKIGSHVIIATNVRIFDNNNHPTSPAERWRMCEEGFFTEKWTWKYAEHKPVVIEDNVWIGEYSTILKGVTIGKGAIVASNSVVTKDVPEYSVVAGNPAKIVKKLDPREEEKDEDTK